MIFARVCLAGRWRSIELVWFVASAALAVVAVLFIARNGLGTYSSTGERPLNSGQALIVAQASLLALTTERSGRWRLAAVGGFGLVVLSQQRTVWMATLAMALVLAYQPSSDGNNAARRRTRLGLGSALLGSIALVLFSPSELRNSLTTATSGISADNSTFSWRIEGWRFFFDEFGARSIADKLVGQPSGTTLERVINNVVRTESAHNMYVQMLVTVGLVGLAALVIMFVIALRKSWRAQPVLAALIVGLCVFSIAYQIEAVQGIWIGFALSLATVPENIHVTGRRPTTSMNQTVAVLMTCHNRRETTLRCLRRLEAQQLPEGWGIRTYLVDDGSSDGTSEAVRASHPDVVVLPGSGELYWTGGMVTADRAAMASRPDHLLWLNDDVELTDGAITMLIDSAHATRSEAIVVGTTHRSRYESSDVRWVSTIRTPVGSRVDRTRRTPAERRHHERKRRPRATGSPRTSRASRQTIPTQHVRHGLRIPCNPGRTRHRCLASGSRHVPQERSKRLVGATRQCRSLNESAPYCRSRGYPPGSGYVSRYVTLAGGGRGTSWDLTCEPCWE